MALMKLRGCEFEFAPVRDSFNRRALAFKNGIIQALKSLGVKEDDLDVNMEPLAIAKKEAFASWYVEGRFYYYSCSQFRFVDNMFIVNKVLTMSIANVLSGRTPVEDFLNDFQEESDVREKRAEAREYFGLPETFTMPEVDLMYRKISKDLHPDMPGGDVDKFKKLNEAHKILKREFS